MVLGAPKVSPGTPLSKPMRVEEPLLTVIPLVPFPVIVFPSISADEESTTLIPELPLFLTVLGLAAVSVPVRNPIL